MKLVSRFEAATRSKTELQGLLRKFFDEAASLPYRSQEHDNALASIETIRAELSSRSP